MKLPAVGGDRVERPLAELERAALIYLAQEQEKPLPDNRLVAVLCDTVRLIREHSNTIRNLLADVEAQNEDRRGWIVMTSGEEHP